MTSLLRNSLLCCRLEAARHCRWVDEVVSEAPWVIDQAFLDKYQIDYVAHDEDPYVAEGHDDVYELVKQQGRLTRRLCSEIHESNVA